MSLDLESLRDAVRARALEKATSAARMMTADLKRSAPRVSGTLARETGVEVKRVDSRGVIAEAKADTEYAAAVIAGSRAHVITGNPLAFYWPKVGRTVFFTSVNHPGTQPNPFWDNVVSKWASYLDRA